jgi:hypothetical protein
MDKKEIKKLIGEFFTSAGSDFCSEYPSFKQCKALKHEYEALLNKKGGCTPCRKRGLVSKYKKLISINISND